MKIPMSRLSPAVLAVLGMLSAGVIAAPFSSGSTGADGAFAPTADTQVTMPDGGVLNYTTVNIPAGVKVTFKKNPANTAVVMLTTGAVKIAGTIDISGETAPTTKVGVFTNGLAGAGGPGGFDGGSGGLPGINSRAGNGFGPGGGGGGTTSIDQCAGSSYDQGGGGGGFASNGEGSYCARVYWSKGGTSVGGPAYGSMGMLPLAGGSGGGGGAGGSSPENLRGSGGGGGGGALMLISAASVELTGAILARGGAGGNVNGGDCSQTNPNHGGAGGGGSGGAVRIVAPSITGAGNVDVLGGAGGCRAGGLNLNQINSGGNGAAGRLHVETAQQGSFSVSLIPALAITSIGNVTVQAGSGEVSVPLDQGNPVTVTISASGVPVGSAVKVSLQQAYSAPVSVNATALAGTMQASTSTASVSIPAGTCIMSASTTYALTVAQGEALSMYAQGERVEKISLAAVLGGGEQQVTLITVSGKEFQVSPAVLAMPAS